ncbi:hypothetical protein CVT24_009967 [Panaeolus cyanescens]|uniref:Uncharacterized protein n=1 Tax=Panaeolus cyanescens TaxID=181874 RepID=A0A409VXG2_9AGAR|nr:hypothetical protein CVT24_009967 [Panaeolus cyanescens]
MDWQEHITSGAEVARRSSTLPPNALSNEDRSLTVIQEERTLDTRVSPPTDPHGPSTIAHTESEDTPHLDDNPNGTPARGDRRVRFMVDPIQNANSGSLPITVDPSVNTGSESGNHNEGHGEENDTSSDIDPSDNEPMQSPGQAHRRSHSNSVDSTSSSARSTTPSIPSEHIIILMDPQNARLTFQAYSINAQVQMYGLHTTNSITGIDEVQYVHGVRVALPDVGNVIPQVQIFNVSINVIFNGTV